VFQVSLCVLYLGCYSILAWIAEVPIFGVGAIFAPCAA